jgi:Flp pilus assembly protein TadG
MRRKVSRIIREFRRDENGNVLVFVSIMIPVLVGFSVLTVDLARVNSLHNDVQSGLDAMALAAAAELDGKTGAVSRANRAVQKLLANQTNFSTSGQQTLALSDVTLTFLTGIPSSDSTSLDAGGTDGNGTAWATTSDAAAIYAEVTLKSTSASSGFQTIFPISLLGGSDNATVGAQAVAGFTTTICNVTPMFICNPWGDINSLADVLSAGTKKPMVWLKEQGGNNAQYGPGNYGFLSSPDGNLSAAELEKNLAELHPPTCFTQTSVTTRPGNVASATDGVNVRFDMYPNGNSYNGNKLNPTDDPPAPNVRKGMQVTGVNGNNCRYSAPNNGQTSQYMALPRDTCFGTSTCDHAGTAGDGTWDLAGYWKVNHPDKSGNADATSLASVQSLCGASPSRYCVANQEILNSTWPSGAEATAPQCNSTTQTINRRLIYVALVNCSTNTITGGSQTVVPEGYASIFLTEAAGSPPNTDIYGEVEDVSTQIGQGTLQKFQRNEAQLYR